MDCLCGVWGVGGVQMQYDDNRAVTLTANLTASRAKRHFGIAAATPRSVAAHALLLRTLGCSARLHRVSSRELIDTLREA